MFNVTNHIKFYCVNHLFYAGLLLAAVNPIQEFKPVRLVLLHKPVNLGDKTRCKQDNNLPGEITGRGFFTKGHGWKRGLPGA